MRCQLRCLCTSLNIVFEHNFENLTRVLIFSKYPNWIGEILNDDQLCLKNFTFPDEVSQSFFSKKLFCTFATSCVNLKLCLPTASHSKMRMFFSLSTKTLKGLSLNSSRRHLNCWSILSINLVFTHDMKSTGLKVSSVFKTLMNSIETGVQIFVIHSY